jgi:hypothetical protein
MKDPAERQKAIAETARSAIGFRRRGSRRGAEDGVHER